MCKERELFKFWGIFQVDASGLGMCEEKFVFISMHIIRLDSQVLESLEPVGHFSRTENAHPESSFMLNLRPM
jgi:hypothetical protein